MIRTAVASAAALAAFLALPSLARAATFTVNSTAETYDGVCDANCTLRDAIDVANKTPGPDTIVLAAQVYGVVRSWCNGGKRLDCGALVITDDVTIQGSGAHVTRVEVPDNFIVASRIFEVTGDYAKPRIKVAFSGLRIRRGGGNQIYGGGMRVEHAEVTITDAILSENSAGGGAAVGLGNDAWMTMERVAVMDNHVWGEGGAIDAAGTLLKLTNVTLSKNVADGATGGAIVNHGGVVQLNHVTAVDNLPGTLHSTAGNLATQAIFSIKNSVLVSAGNTNCTGTKFAGSTHLFQAAYSLETGGACGFDHDPATVATNKWQQGQQGPVVGALVGSSWETPVPYYPLAPNSVAIDRADANGGVALDIRKKARPQDGNGDGKALPDMGAFEATPPIRLAPSVNVPLPLKKL